MSALYLPSEHFQLLSILNRAQSDRFMGDSVNVRPLYRTCLRLCFTKINKEVVADFTEEKSLSSAPYWALSLFNLSTNTWHALSVQRHLNSVSVQIGYSIVKIVNIFTIEVK